MVETSGFDEQYTMDDINRLDHMSRGTLNGSHVIASPDSEEIWTLDLVGNWRGYETKTSGATVLNQTRDSSTVNEITSITTSTGTAWATPAYDAAGNMTGFVSPSDPTSNYTGVYDAWNRLVAVKDGTDYVAQYAYDGMTRRVVKKSYNSGVLSETRDYYFSDQWQILSEAVSGTNDLTYAWSLRYVDELLWRVDDTPQRLYAMQDANFNCTSICDDSGSVVERYQFDPYAGNRVILNASWSVISSSAYDWKVGHQGLMIEVDVGLYNCRNRVYLPLLGVWMQRDPVLYDDNYNLYQYLDCQPLTLTDSAGLAAMPAAATGCAETVEIVVDGELITCVVVAGVIVYCLYKATKLAVKVIPKIITTPTQAHKDECKRLWKLYKAAQKAAENIGPCVGQLKGTEKNCQDMCWKFMLWNEYFKGRQASEDADCWLGHTPKWIATHKAWLQKAFDEAKKCEEVVNNMSPRCDCGFTVIVGG